MSQAFSLNRNIILHALNAKWRASLMLVALGVVLYVTFPSESLRSRLHGFEYLGSVEEEDSLLRHVSEYLPSKWQVKGGKHDSLLIWPGSTADGDEYVAICIAVKDQHEDLKEWLTHHYHHLGIRRFYIMDDGSSPSLDSFEDYPIPRSAMTFRYFTRDTRVKPQQIHIYEQCNFRFGTRHKWMGFIDADEFVELTGSPGMSLARFLTHYEEYGGLGINWKAHNSNGYLVAQESTRKAYTSCISDGIDQYGGEPDNRHIKTFIQPKYFKEVSSPHSMVFNSSMFTVGENGDRIKYAWRTPITRDKIAVHHYALKSKAEFEEKLARSNAHDNPKTWGFWDYVEGYERVNCTELAKYSP